MNFVDRFKRDMRASAPKTAILAVLLLIGLWFWVPPVWRAVVGESAEAEKGADAPASVAASSPTPPPAATPPAVPRWEDAERLRKEDDLFRSVGREAVRTDAFLFDDDFLPLEVEFGDDVPEASAFVLRWEDRPVASLEGADADATAGEALPPPPVDPPPPLKLGSTLVSPGKRAAVINDRVYVEGATIAIAGRRYVLTNVEPRRVVLDGEGGPLELRINPFATTRPTP
jgi:hypothetical protein